MTKVPALSQATPVPAPLTTTEALGTGWPFSLVTSPLTLMTVWPTTVVDKKDSRTKTAAVHRVVLITILVFDN
jgi:hypothetical protein